MQIENGLDQLEAIVSEIELGPVDLDRYLEQFEAARILAAQCERELARIEARTAELAGDLRTRSV